MAVDMFLKIDGIDGESVDHKHPKSIDVLAFSFGMSQNGTRHIATGGGAGKVAVQDMSVTKYTDSSSAKISLACCAGSHIKDAKLTVRKAGDKPVEYLVVHMEDVLISSISQGGSGGDDRLTENVALNFGRFKTAYTPQDAKGNAGGKIETGWNIAKNEKF